MTCASSGDQWAGGGVGIVGLKQREHSLSPLAPAVPLDRGRQQQLPRQVLPRESHVCLIKVSSPCRRSRHCCPVCTLTPCLEPGLALADVAWIVPLLCASSQKYIPPRLPTWHKESWRLEQQRYKWSNKMDIYLQWIVAIPIILVDLDVHQIVGYHYFNHHQPSRGSSVRLL